MPEQKVDKFESGRYVDTIENKIFIRVKGKWLEEKWADTDRS